MGNCSAQQQHAEPPACRVASQVCEFEGCMGVTTTPQNTQPAQLAAATFCLEPNSPHRSR